MTTTFSDLIILLSSGINQRRLYFDAHPKVKTLGRDFATTTETVTTTNAPSAIPHPIRALPAR